MSRLRACMRRRAPCAISLFGTLGAPIPGTALVGLSKQTGRSYPPRLIPFQFSINQGLSLEFGNFYMRVVLNGAFVTEGPLEITSASNTDPVALGLNNVVGALSATANTGGVSSSYVTGDTVTVAGGTHTSQASFLVANTQIASLAPNALGSGYTPGDLITLAGGSPLTEAVVQVASTQVLSATLVSGGHLATLANGSYSATGTTGAGTRFTLNVTVNTNVVTAINSITSNGSYSTNPANLGAEPILL